MNGPKRILFEDEVDAYLSKSFEKVGIDEAKIKDAFEYLSTTPKWTTIRINKLLCPNINDALGLLQQSIQMDFTESESMPRFQILSDSLSDCVILKLDTYLCEDRQSDNPIGKIVIVDLKCGQAVLRGADVYIPGIKTMSFNVQKNDNVSVYADRRSKCLRGANPELYAKSNDLIFIGNGRSLVDRNSVFKGGVSCGLGVQMSKYLNNTYSPSMNAFDKSLFYLQNLPSIVCSYILQPQSHHMILDMCAAPGGKTAHLASLSQNRAKIVAFDKIESKVLAMKSLLDKMGLTSIQCLHQDSTKIDFEIYKPESFDRILVDAPCSALGQRPLLFNQISTAHLKAYISYQRSILANAVELLKPGGYLLYCTCTITVEENEGQVMWLLSNYPHMRLVSQDPYHVSGQNGLDLNGLSKEQTCLLQRFGPCFANSEKQQNSVYTDTIGFFIAKFYKQL